MTWLFPKKDPAVAAEEARQYDERVSRLFDPHWHIAKHGSATETLKHMIESGEARTIDQKALHVILTLAFAEREGWTIHPSLNKMDD
jgi:hypothetical protein